MEISEEKREFAQALGDLLREHGCVAVPKQKVIAAVDIELSEEKFNELKEDERKKVKDECIVAANNLLNSDPWKNKFGVAPQFTYLGDNIKPDVIIVDLPSPDDEKTANNA